MHPSALAQMAACVERYMPNDRAYQVVDFGSRVSRGPKMTHRELLQHHDCEITGVDIKAGRNVDVVMRRPYRIPLGSESADVIFAGQVFEHVPFPWASILELARVLRPAGHLFITVPSRGHVHSHYDCWRIYPDGLRALAAFARLEVRESHTDFPPITGRKRHDYASIDVEDHYWGDSVGVFQRPEAYPSLRMWPIRQVVVAWANRAGRKPLR